MNHSVHAARAAAPSRSLACAIALLATGTSLAQGTAFVYQGRLADRGRSVNGTFDVAFSLFPTTTGGTRIGPILSFPATSITNGLFTLSIDFGQGAFNGQDRWIELSARTNGASSYSVISPRRKVPTSPSAQFAAQAGSVQSVPAAGITGVLPLASLPPLNIDGSLLTNLNASSFGSGTVPDALLSTNVPRLGDDLVFAASNRFNGPVVALHPSNTLAGAFVGNGAGLSNLLAQAFVGVAPAATNFLGVLQGDVVGTQDATTLVTINGMSALRVATGASNALAATPSLSPDIIVRRDATNGGFYAGPIRAGRLTGDGSGLTNLPTAANAYGAPKGVLRASTSSADATLMAEGYRLMMTLPAPGWTAGATANAPSARSKHSTVWDGQRMIVWGGLLAAGTPTSTGAWYDPATDLWTTLSAISVPASRSDHSAVWTGSQMIVWGGAGSSSWLNTGSRFTPASQTWSATSTSGAPSARVGHVAAWTGSRMVVWGGRDASGLLNDGALYDPVANTWSALPTENAPSPRKYAKAAWSGSALYVWGGTGPAGELASGAYLAFSGNTPTGWTALPSLNAPAARTDHSLLWAGDRLIVWGGTDDDVPLNDGAVFCPGCGDWSAISMDNAPLPRGGHAAVWTGTEMMIVGGRNGGSDVAGPAAYDPASNLWRTLSGLGNPMARTSATAVWTSTDLLVFGGTSSGTAVANLQRLFPQPEWFFYTKR